MKASRYKLPYSMRETVSKQELEIQRAQRVNAIEKLGLRSTEKTAICNHHLITFAEWRDNEGKVYFREVIGSELHGLSPKEYKNVR